MSIHGAKVENFEHVYLAELVEDESKWRKGDKSPEMESARGDCRAVIAPAIKSLTLTYS